MSNIIFDIKNLYKIYGSDPATEVKALNNVNLKIMEGEFVAIVGASGSGKSTLLNIISGLDNATKGEVILKDRNISAMKGNELSDFRRDHIGFIFQSYNLIPVLNAKENIEYIMLLQNIDEKTRNQRVAQILKEVGLENMQNRFPKEMSGGQNQRVAIARAIVSRPDIILADEPTANLDSKTGTDLVKMMLKLNKEHNITFIFSTHDPIIMKYAKRIIHLQDGKIIKDEKKN